MAVSVDYELIYGLLITGGVAAGGLTVLSDWLMKRRQDSNTIATVRIQTLAAAMPYYMQLITHIWDVGWALRKEHDEIDYTRVTYCMCKTLRFRDEILKRFGDIQLDNLEAEVVLNDLLRDIYQVIINRFGYLGESRLTSMVTKDSSYLDFYDKISEPDSKDTQLYNKFVDWLSKDINETELDTMQKCKWYAQLLALECNHIYKSWYHKEPPLDLENDLRKNLSENEPKYYKRIMSFHLKSNVSQK